jgi:NAD+ synthase (glutamine-hydrolysing)
MKKTEAVKLNRHLAMLRAGAAAVPLRVADVDYNVDTIIRTAEDASRKGIQLLAFPEMSITGYTIGDLVQQQILLDSAKAGLSRLAKTTAKLELLIIVGLPLVVSQRVYNCAAVIGSGKVLGIVPKTFLPNYKEFYEARHFTPSREADTGFIEIDGHPVPFGADLLFTVRGLESAVVGVEICEDMWVPLAPHEYQALAGATVLVNISASNEILGKSDWRRTMVASESGRCLAAECYVSAGIDESSNDVVYAGHSLIAENGVVMRESRRFEESSLIFADIDTERLVHDRLTQTTFNDIERQRIPFRFIEAEIKDIEAAKIYNSMNPHPFVPDDPARRAERCREIFSMQVAGLAKKLTGSKNEKIVLGISGGLDSTLALLVAVRTMDGLKLSRKNIYAYTMPGFGTTRRTRANAEKLCKELGVTFEIVDIKPSSESHLKDINHNFKDEDTVFENVQARYRTELLFNQANHLRAIVLGTGDLTEIALGWATFSGDHISHYHVNCSVPKTLVQYLVKWVAESEPEKSPVAGILFDILATPITPELKRPNNGRTEQLTEEIIGPVELADFFLYPFIRFGMRPGKILYFANEINKEAGFCKKYSLDELFKWEKTFITRFFANQFKRTCMPEGPKVGSVSLSPRGDWRMPSDAEAKVWLQDLELMYGLLSSR